MELVSEIYIPLMKRVCQRQSIAFMFLSDTEKFLDFNSLPDD